MVPDVLIKVMPNSNQQIMTVVKVFLYMFHDRGWSGCLSFQLTISLLSPSRKTLWYLSCSCRVTIEVSEGLSEGLSELMLLTRLLTSGRDLLRRGFSKMTFPVTTTRAGQTFVFHIYDEGNAYKHILAQHE